MSEENSKNCINKMDYYVKQLKLKLSIYVIPTI